MRLLLTTTNCSLDKKVLSLSIALRYLFAHKSHNVINIISAISSIGVMVATAALVIILSVFNGLNGLVTSLYSSFDPDLKIIPTTGKSFTLSDSIINALDNNKAITSWATIIEENALIRHNNRQIPATVLGVDKAYTDVTNIQTIVTEGHYQTNQCLIGAILADQLSLSLVLRQPSVDLYAPKRQGKINLSNPEGSFVECSAQVSGAFMVQQNDYDGNYLVAPIALARELFGYDDEQITSIALRVDSAYDVQAVARELVHSLPASLTVRDKWQQHQSFYKMMQVEKFISFFILLFVVLIAAFNIIGSLSMLIFEKKDNINTLRSLGADQKLVTQIFLFEGWLLSVGGVVVGLVIGSALVLLQQLFGLVGFGDDDSYIVSAYPVELQGLDVLLVAVAVILLAVLAAWYPVKSIVGKYYAGN